MLERARPDRGAAARRADRAARLPARGDRARSPAGRDVLAILPTSARQELHLPAAGARAARRDARGQPAGRAHDRPGARAQPLDRRSMVRALVAPDARVQQPDRQGRGRRRSSPDPGSTTASGSSTSAPSGCASASSRTGSRTGVEAGIVAPDRHRRGAHLRDLGRRLPALVQARRALPRAPARRCPTGRASSP